MSYKLCDRKTATPALTWLKCMIIDISIYITEPYNVEVHLLGQAALVLELRLIPLTSYIVGLIIKLN